ncbi:MAG: hypothetical protein LBQ54_07060 [Planctomycetaceae bacterium]|jgi:hypothetical protein|nr:hypothetical protein [Planctomycetaceae bacterium]
MKNSVFILVLIGSSFFAAGCGPKKPAGFPDVVPCSISVTQNGQPLDNVLVTLSPVSEGGEWTTSGTTHSNGTAEMMTSIAVYFAKGAPEREFKVFLSRPIEIDLSVSQAEVMNMSSAEVAKLRQETDRKIEDARIIPEKLESPATTPVRITVSGEKTTHTVELTDYSTP